MKFRVDTSALTRAIANLNGAGERVRQGWAAAATDVGEDAVGFIKKEFRSGPGNRTQTQVRTNRLRASYSHEVKRPPRGGIELAVGLVRPGIDGETLGYGRMMEGYNADGSRFRTKVIRAKAGGWLRFPIYDPATPGMAKGNRIGWVTTKQVTFRPRPSFPATRVKFEPILRDEAAAILRGVAGGVA